MMHLALYSLPRAPPVPPTHTVTTWTMQGNLLHQTYVNQLTGQVIQVNKLTRSDTYKIYRMDPLTTPTPVIRSGKGRANVRDPARRGWLVGPQHALSIKGNNVHAYIDSAGDDKPDRNQGRRVAGDAFTASACHTNAPRSGTNPQAAVQNVFYHGAPRRMGRVGGGMRLAAACAHIQPAPRPRLTESTANVASRTPCASDTCARPCDLAAAPPHTRARSQLLP